jgi:hypothetical protein
LTSSVAPGQKLSNASPSSGMVHQNASATRPCSHPMCRRPCNGSTTSRDGGRNSSFRTNCLTLPSAMERGSCSTSRTRASVRGRRASARVILKSGQTTKATSSPRRSRFRASSSRSQFWRRSSVHPQGRAPHGCIATDSLKDSGPFDGSHFHLGADSPEAPRSMPPTSSLRFRPSTRLRRATNTSASGSARAIHASSPPSIRSSKAGSTTLARARKSVAKAKAARTNTPRAKSSWPPRSGGRTFSDYPQPEPQPASAEGISPSAPSSTWNE